MKIISSFPVDHANVYGNTFLESCNEHEVPITLVHYEDFSSIPWHREKRIDARPGKIGEDAELWEWRKNVSSFPATTNYRWQIGRFAWKVFALTRIDVQKGADFLIWLDADVVILEPPKWDLVLSSEHDVMYLGRSEWDHSECGFTAWNLNKRGAEGLQAFREVYTSGAIFTEQQWHDSWIFDRVCERLNLNRLNISPEAKGLDAWGASPLAKWSEHFKGNRKFHELTRKSNQENRCHS